MNYQNIRELLTDYNPILLKTVKAKSKGMFEEVYGGVLVYAPSICKDLVLKSISETLSMFKISISYDNNKEVFEIKIKEVMKEFEIWSEGYVATGEHGEAMFHGKAMGETFIEACENFEERADRWSEWGQILLAKKGDRLPLDRDSNGNLRLSSDGRPSIWACRLFDNEIDARKSFG